MSKNFGITPLTRVFNDSSADLRRKIISIYVLLIAFNILAWTFAFLGFSVQYPALLGTALLAYTFGLRHSVDADHISAIDNVTRKLLQENKRPVAVGFFFSLGHSKRHSSFPKCRRTHWHIGLRSFPVSHRDY